MFWAGGKVLEKSLHMRIPGAEVNHKMFELKPEDRWQNYSPRWGAFSHRFHEAERG